MTTAEDMTAGPGDGAVIWVTGLSAAGKSTVARSLVDRLQRRGHRPIMLDGDEVRSALGMTGHYDRPSRLNAAFTYARLCHLLAQKGHIVVLATISLFKEVHGWNREHLPRYVEVVLDVPFRELRRRDYKGVYQAGDDDEVVGVGQSADFPPEPELVIPNYGTTDPDEAAGIIHEFGREKDLW